MNQSTTELQKQRDHIEKVRVFPMKNLERLMRQTVPEAKLAEDAKELVNECASEFIGFLVSEYGNRVTCCIDSIRAIERTINEGRSQLSTEDVIQSLSKLGFDDYHSAISMFLLHYRGSGSEYNFQNTIYSQNQAYLPAMTNRLFAPQTYPVQQQFNPALNAGLTGLNSNQVANPTLASPMSHPLPQSLVPSTLANLPNSNSSDQTSLPDQTRTAPQIPLVASIPLPNSISQGPLLSHRVISGNDTTNVTSSNLPSNLSQLQQFLPQHRPQPNFPSYPQVQMHSPPVPLERSTPSLPAMWPSTQAILQELAQINRVSSDSTPFVPQTIQTSASLSVIGSNYPTKTAVPTSAVPLVSGPPPTLKFSNPTVKVEQQRYVVNENDVAMATLATPIATRPVGEIDQVDRRYENVVLDRINGTALSQSDGVLESTNNQSTLAPQQLKDLIRQQAFLLQKKQEEIQKMLEAEGDEEDSYETTDEEDVT